MYIIETQMCINNPSETGEPGLGRHFEQAQVDRQEAGRVRRLPGIDFMKLHFGRKVFSGIFVFVQHEKIQIISKE
jgi:hypothetical protein